MEQKPVKRGFISRIFEDNRQFDSSMTIFFVFVAFMVTLGAVIAKMFSGSGENAIPKELFDIINVFENFILMILSYFFTRATTQNGGNQSK